MIKKLVISAVVLTALIAGKEAHASGIAGFARSLASAQAFQIHTAEIPTVEQKASEDSVLTLTFTQRRELMRVNNAVNTAIDQVDGYLDGFAGDLAADFANGKCFDCADLKRDQLISLGWSEKAMRIGYSLSAEGSFDRVLVISTDRGDVILANDSSAIDMSGKPATKQVRETKPSIARERYDI